MASTTTYPTIIYTCLQMALFCYASSHRGLPSLCNLIQCSCVLADDEKAYIADVTCQLMAVTPDDVVVSSLQNQLIRALSLTCLDNSTASFIDGATVGSLSSLQSLHLENCNFSLGLTNASFESLSNLTSLSITRSTVPDFSGDQARSLYLASAVHLTKLSLTYCNLSRMPVLSYLAELQHLNVSHNDLKSLELSFVRHISDAAAQAQRENAKVSPLQSPKKRRKKGGNEVFFLDVEPMGRILDVTWMYKNKKTTALRVIDLSHNPARSLPTASVALSRNLRKMLFQGVPLEEFVLPENASLPDLVHLDARDSRLQVFNFSRLGSSTKLEELHLRGVGKSVDLRGLADLTRLRNLTLAGFGLESSIWARLMCPSLERLNLTNNNLTIVDTSRLPKLRFLRLGFNLISSLDPSLSFANLPGLQLLALSHNFIADLPLFTFSGIKDLKALDLSHNKLENIQSRTFGNLSKLFFLGLRNNEISSLGFTLLEDTPSLRYLNLQHNRLTFLPRLHNLAHLERLNVSWNQLSSLEPRNLKGLASLQILHANDNSLRQLRSNIFEGTPNLIQAYFHNNKISFLGDMGSHEKLLMVRLDNNLIPDFSTGSPFRRLHALQYLALGNNHLTKLKPSTFPASLRQLFISENYFTHFFDNIFSDLPNLEFVQLMYNRKILKMQGSAVDDFLSIHPKPYFFVEGNVWLCSCVMAYLKLIYEKGREIDLYQKFYPVFRGLEHTRCVTVYEYELMRPFPDVPLSDFVCQYNKPRCTYDCRCCDMSQVQSSPTDTPCECLLTCPVGCNCYIGGASYDKDYYNVRCDARNFTTVPSRIAPLVVNLYLDGNNISALSAWDFYWLSHLEELFLNFNVIDTIQEGTFRNCTSLVSLYLDHNALTAIRGPMLEGLYGLTHLFLHDNIIEFISSSVFKALPSVEVVALHNNRLVKVAPLLEALPTSLSAISISGNPWSCDCDARKPLLNLKYIITQTIVDRESVCCYFSNDKLPLLSKEFHIPVSNTFTHPTNDENVTHRDAKRRFLSTYYLGDSNHTVFANHTNETELDKQVLSDDNRTSSSRTCHPVLKLDFSNFCTGNDNNNSQRVTDTGERRYGTRRGGLSAAVVALIVLSVLLSIATALVIFVIFKRKELQALVYDKLGIRVFDKKIQLDKADAGSKAFDAFISYSSKDDEFVARTLVPALEDPSKGYRVCVHYRDFPVGCTITDTICRAIECSSRTILLLTQNFLHSEWCRFEFQAAHQHILREGSHRLIIVIQGEIPEDMLDPDLKVHLKSRTYLQFDDPWFWEKLYFSLPDIRQRRADEARRNRDREEEGMEEQYRGQAGGEVMTVTRAMEILSGKSLDDVRGKAEAKV